MKKIIITNGLIAGAIVSALMLFNVFLVERGTVNFDNGMFVGYTSMVIALSMIFFGVKTYRDQYASGTISFGQGLKIGLLISLIAAVMYAVSWEIYYNVAASDFMEKYTAHYIEKMKSEGASEASIAQARAEMASTSELYKNPVIRFGFTLAEILPVGIIISLLSAGLLRKKDVVPA